MRHAALALLLALPAYADEGGFLSPARAKELESLLSETKEEISAPVRAKRRHDLLTVRLPSWELAAAREAGAFATEGIPLLGKDAGAARFVFGDALHIDSVRIVFTAVALPGVPQTWGNTIRVPLDQALTRVTLIHELVHVWQFQTGGTPYISDSLLHNSWSVLTTGKRRKAYRYKIVPGKSFFDYTAEQQAKIVEDWYAKPKKREEPERQRLMAEMRTRKGYRNAEAPELREMEAGFLPRGSPLGDLPGWEDSRVMGGVPQLEFRFDTPW